MFKIILKQKITIFNLYLILLFITTNLFIDIIECGIIKRDISLKNQTNSDIEIESKILQSNQQSTILATATTTESPKKEILNNNNNNNNNNDSNIKIENIKNSKEDLSNFRTEITTVSETHSESFSIATKTPRIFLSTTTNKINLVSNNSNNNNSDIKNNSDNNSNYINKIGINTTTATTKTTTLLPITITTENFNIVNNKNVNEDKLKIVNKKDTKEENITKNSFETTESSLNIVKETTQKTTTTTTTPTTVDSEEAAPSKSTQIVNEPQTTIESVLFRDDVHSNSEFSTLEPLEQVTKFPEYMDYDDHKSTTTITEHSHIISQITTQKTESDKNDIKENNSEKFELEHKIEKLDSQSDNSQADFIKATLKKVENELSPSSSSSLSLKPENSSNLKVQGRSHHNNKYEEIFSEIDDNEKQIEKNLQTKSVNKEGTTISNDLEIPNAAELWALVGMKSNLPKEKLAKFESTTPLNSVNRPLSSSTPEHINIEQDNATLKHLVDWTKIMEESIDMENSTNMVNDFLTTTVLPDVEEKSKILLDTISNNLNENSDKENIFNSTQMKNPTVQKEKEDEMKTNLNLTPTNGKNLIEEPTQQKNLNNSSESLLNKEKFLLQSSQSLNNSDYQSNIIEAPVVTNKHNNDDDKILTFLNASKVNNIYSSNNDDNKTEIVKITNNDEVKILMPPKLNITNETSKYDLKDLSSSSPSSITTNEKIIIKNEDTTKPSPIITTILPTSSESTLTSSSSSAIINDSVTIKTIIPTSPPPSPSPTTIITLTTVRGLPLENSLQTHPNKEDIIDNFNTVTLNNTFKNNSSDKYLENVQNLNSSTIMQQSNPTTTKETNIINRNSNVTDDFSKLSTAVVENSINETNSILENENHIGEIIHNKNENNKTTDIKEDLNNIIVKSNESDIKNDIITNIVTTEKIKLKEFEKQQEKMTSRMDYDEENGFTSTTTISLSPKDILYDQKNNKKNQKYLTSTPSSSSEKLPSSTSATIIGSEIVKKKTTTEKSEKSENVKPTSESSIENDVIEKHQPPTIKSSLFPKLLQPTTTINPLKISNNNEEILVENSLDVQSTLQTIPFVKEPSDILIGSPPPSLPTSEINPDLYPKYEVATTSDTKLSIINIDDDNNTTKTSITESTIISSSLSTTISEDNNNNNNNISDLSSTKIPYTREGLEGSTNDTDYVIVAISVSVVGIIALILLVVFLIVMRKRQKQTTYIQRCRPVGLDAYSMYNISIRDKNLRNNSLKKSYGNVAFDDPSLIHNPMGIHELNRFIGKKTAIFDEFKDIPQITAKADEVPIGCEDKNRYANVIPLPETRVILQQQDGDEKSQYINANYVQGPKDSSNYYIACQAPMESTVPDFWRMIWEQSSRVIIMATDLEENGIEKSAAYIPESMILDNHVVYGDFQITLKNREVKEKYAVSTLHVKNLKTHAWREITHFWYQWPITGVPSDEAPMIAMLLEARSCLKTAASEQVDDEEIIENNIEKKNDIKTTTTTTTTTKTTEESSEVNKDNNNGEDNENIKNEVKTKNNENDNKNEMTAKATKTSSKSQGPLLIHCSPGTGRTGTIIACDIAIRSLETPKRTVDIPQIVYYVRRGRASSIQTKEQYEFIYRVTHMYATKISAPVNEN